MSTIKLFFSSPGDVEQERLLAQRLVERLRIEYARHVLIEAVFWEHEPLRATASFQEELQRPSKSDIAIFILWSRLGTRLPDHITRPDGSRYSSGTEFEFEDAVTGFRATGHPDMLVYRKTLKPHTALDESVVNRYEQKKALDAFVERFFKTPDGAYKGAYHSFEAPADFEDLLEKHLRKLLTQRAIELGGADQEDPIAVWTAGSPFRGLESFQAEHAAVFFGRTQAITDILNRFRLQAETKPAEKKKAFVIIFGPSGAGKSSLARAGVIPFLTRPGVMEGIAVWRVAIFRPSQSPASLLDGLAGALLAENALPEMTAALDQARLAQMLTDSPAAAGPLIYAYLDAAVKGVEQREYLQPGAGARLVLLLDQMEEIFTQASISEANRQRFIGALSALAYSGSVYVLATMRVDFYPRCSELPELVDLKQEAGQYDLAAPTPSEISQIIRNPVKLGGLRLDHDVALEERLEDTLRDEAAKGFESLPLLEFTLSELYRLKGEGRTLTLSSYRKMGGLAGAVGTRAEEVFTSLPADVQGSLPSLFRSLVAIGSNDRAVVVQKTASVATVSSTPASKTLLEALVAARLLVTDLGSDGRPTVRVAHEALLQNWPRLKQWIENNREDLRLRNRITSETQRWFDEGKLGTYLLPRGSTLDKASSFSRNHRGELSSDEVAFIAASEKESSRQKSRRLLSLGILCLAFLAVVASGLWYWDNYVRKQVTYYSAEILRWNHPIGLGPLSEREARLHSSSIRLTQLHGKKGPVDVAEIVDAQGKLHHKHVCL